MPITANFPFVDFDDVESILYFEEYLEYDGIECPVSFHLIPCPYAADPLGNEKSCNISAGWVGRGGGALITLCLRISIL